MSAVDHVGCCGSQIMTLYIRIISRDATNRYLPHGRLTFSIKDGAMEGYVSLVNHGTFTIDAQFRLMLTLQKATSVKGATKQLGALPLSPLAIPGIITLGPQASISVSLDLILTGEAELAV